MGNDFFTALWGLWNYSRSPGILGNYAAAPRLRELARDTTSRFELGGHMSYVEQFEKAVTGVGAVALRIERKAPGEERLVIQTRGGLITRTVPLKGDLGKDIQDATAAARQIVASAKSLSVHPGTC
jgi:hypothetical protein